ncbi:MAG: filamentous hemagglutinin N-terminal domain-containing protein [Cyanobacteriota bacterium]|nr:filamentous hemagglutinin N-terminal domain-containing protein [Cyanobacteriota bacterium]
MQSTIRCGLFGILAIGGAIVYSWGFTPNALAQITPDRTLGGESSVITPNVEIEGAIRDLIEGGATRGENLFHSFQEFNVLDGQRVDFANPIGIENILSRVTGSNRSDILGALGVLGDANLFLINPNGIIFGPNAQLNVSGSFLASSAESLVWGNGLEFSAANPEAPPLLTVNITPGLQYGIDRPPADIANSGSLVVGRNLTLAGGNLHLNGQLQADGDLRLLATETLRARDSATDAFVASAGGKLVLQGDRAIDISVLSRPESGFFSGGDTILRSGGSIAADAHYTAGGSFGIEQLDGTPGSFFALDDPIVLAAENVSIGDYTGASLHILAGGSVELGNITIDSVGADETTINPGNANTIPGTTTPYSALSDVTLSDGTTVVNVSGNTQATLDVRAGIDWTQTPFTGVPGITAPTDIPDGSVDLDTSTTADSSITAESITIAQPAGLVLLTNQYRPNTTRPAGTIQVGGINASSEIGPGSDIILDARGDIFLPVGSTIFADGLVGGNITFRSDTAIIQEAGNFDIGFGSVGSVTFGEGTGGNISYAAPTVFLGGDTVSVLVGNGRTGNISIEADSFTTGNFSFISTLVDDPGTGDAGSIDVRADSVLLNTTGLISQITTFQGGNAGKVTVNAGDLTLVEGTQIGSLLFGVGSAGDVTVNAESISLSGFADFGFFNPSAIISTVESGGEGNSGNINITTGSLSIRNGAQVRTSSQGIGNAGNINLSADSISLDGAVFDEALFGDDTFPSGILSEVRPDAVGQGGTIDITTRQLAVTNGAFISASTNGIGDAGGIRITATESASFDGDPGAPFSPSGIFLGSRSLATGRGGTLNIVTPSLSATNGAQLEALTESGDDAGSITINAADSVFLSGEGTGLFSNTAEGSAGNGGAIALTTRNLDVVDGAAISPSTAGAGNGGQFSAVAEEIRVENGSQIFAGSPGSGDSGTIELRGDRLTVAGESFISVTSENAGAAGDLEIIVPEILVEHGILGAETVAGNRGNIFLESENIELRQGGLITTDATGTATGGNIDIDTTFLVALENSDITANAQQSFGGQVVVSAEGIFGTEFRDRLTPESDITATSELGAQFSGTVTILTPDVDATSGLVRLDSETTDPADRVVSGCAAAEGSSFTVTGRGGLPEDPTATIRGQTFWEDLRTVAPELPPETSDRRSNPISNGLAAESKIVEATGWIVRDDGKVELVAQQPQRGDRAFSIECRDL